MSSEFSVCFQPLVTKLHYVFPPIAYCQDPESCSLSDAEFGCYGKLVNTFTYSLYFQKIFQ